MYSFDPLDWTEGLETFPIYSDDKNLISSMKKCKYVKTNIPGPGCNMDDFESQILGCQCKDKLCTSLCSCSARYGMAYDNGKIPRAFLLNSKMAPIFECNTQCTCPKQCQNRLIQHGIRVKLEIFQSESKGLAIRALENIDQGIFVCEYSGEIVSYEEAKRRSRLQGVSDMNYIITVREYHKTGVIFTHVDPSLRGNIGRYINHSCCPNLAMLPVRVNTIVPKLCLFAVRNIAPLEELTFDYGHASTQTSDLASVSNAGTRVLKPCHCGAEICRGYLPFDMQLYE